MILLILKLLLEIYFDIDDCKMVAFKGDLCREDHL